MTDNMSVKFSRTSFDQQKLTEETFHREKLCDIFIFVKDSEHQNRLTRLSFHSALLGSFQNALRQKIYETSPFCLVNSSGYLDIVLDDTIDSEIAKKFIKLLYGHKIFVRGIDEAKDFYFLADVFGLSLIAETAGERFEQESRRENTVEQNTRGNETSRKNVEETIESVTVKELDVVTKSTQEETAIVPVESDKSISAKAQSDMTIVVKVEPFDNENAIKETMPMSKTDQNSQNKLEENLQNCKQNVVNISDESAINFNDDEVNAYIESLRGKEDEESKSQIKASLAELNFARVWDICQLNMGQVKCNFCGSEFEFSLKLAEHLMFFHDVLDLEEKFQYLWESDFNSEKDNELTITESPSNAKENEKIEKCRKKSEDLNDQTIETVAFPTRESTRSGKVINEKTEILSNQVIQAADSNTKELTSFVEITNEKTKNSNNQVIQIGEFSTKESAKFVQVTNEQTEILTFKLEAYKKLKGIFYENKTEKNGQIYVAPSKVTRFTNLNCLYNGCMFTAKCHQSLKCHTAIHFKEEIWTKLNLEKNASDCKLCGKKLKTSRNLCMHLIYSHDMGAYLQSINPQIWHSFNLHELSEDDKKVECKLCGKTVRDDRCLRFHTSLKHFKEEIIASASKTEYEKKECKNCGKKYEQEVNWLEHFLNVHHVVDHLIPDNVKQRCKTTSINQSESNETNKTIGVSLLKSANRIVLSNQQVKIPFDTLTGKAPSILKKVNHDTLLVSKFNPMIKITNIICEICGKGFVDNIGLLHHLAHIHYKNEIIKCTNYMDFLNKKCGMCGDKRFGSEVEWLTHFISDHFAILIRNLPRNLRNVLLKLK